LKRAIQKLLADPLAMKLLDGEIQPGEHAIANVTKQGEFTFKAAAAVAS
jgi:ATPases with chaperone activity, ATP-binding subunit